MKHRLIQTKPAAEANFTPAEFYVQISDHWEQKARQLRARRLRMLKQQPNRKAKEPYFIWK